MAILACQPRDDHLRTALVSSMQTQADAIREARSELEVTRELLLQFQVSWSMHVEVYTYMHILIILPCR